MSTHPERGILKSTRPDNCPRPVSFPLNRRAFRASNARARATIDNVANEAAADRVCRFYLTRTASGYTLTSEINGFSPNRNGNGVAWQNNTANVFTLSNPTVTDGALIVSQPTNASFIRFTNNGSFLNADGPKYATGQGAWSIWYVYKVIVE